MLSKHIFYYAIASGVPGLLNFLAIAAYTRMLSPGDYGVYAVLLAWVGLFNVVGFQWIRLSLLRYLPANKDAPEKFLGTIFFAFTLVFFVTLFFGILFLFFVNDEAARRIVLIGLPLTWFQAWFDLNLELERSKLQPVRYGLMSIVKTSISLGLGIFLIFYGFKFYGPLIGLFAGTLLGAFSLGMKNWQSARPSRPYYEQLRPLFHYGAPLTATFALAFVVSSSDRLILTYLLNEASAGIYSASYDLVFQVITLLMVVVNLAGYPLVVAKLEKNGKESAKTQLEEYGVILLLIALPAVCVFVVLSPNIVSALLGKDFREGAVHLVPWVAVAALLAGIRAYYFDVVFQLEKKTGYQVFIMGFAALVNIALNLILIPNFGIFGSAYATVCAYFSALVLSVFWGRKITPLVMINKNFAKITLASLCMVVFIFPLRGSVGLMEFFAQVVFGLLVYMIMLLIFNPLNFRSRVLKFSGIKK